MPSSSTPDSLLPDAPFRGIESFRYVDRPIFFARDDETQKLLRSITIYRGVLFYGDSGAGKSSLINAGFIPAVIDGQFLPHRLRVRPDSGKEITVERISIKGDGEPPFLESIFADKSDQASHVVLSIEEFKKKLSLFRNMELEERIAVKLKKPRDPLSKYLRSRLAAKTLSHLDQLDDAEALPETLRQSLKEEIVQLSQSESLYDKKRFAHISLTDDIQKLCESKPQGGELNYLNQLLLEIAYPREAPPLDRYPLLIFDQFEEFVTLFEVAPRPDQIKEALAIQLAVLQMLVELLRDNSLPIKLLFVFREDYLAKLTKLFVLCPELPDQYLRLLPIRTDMLQQIILGPFSKFPGRFGTELSESLAKKLQKAIEAKSEAGIVNLSEVQVACLRLWQSSHPDSLFEQKKVEGLLEDYLSESLNKFPQELRDPAVALLSRLVTSSSVTSTGTRNIVSENDLIDRVYEEEKTPQDILKRALDRLEEDAKLIRRERRNNLYFYEIVSEFLVPWISKQKVERDAARASRRLFNQERRKKEEKELELSRRATSEERTFITQVEASSPEAFARFLSNPTVQEENTLRKYFGDSRYQRLHSLALKRLARRGTLSVVKGNVVVIHGMVGGELSVSSGGAGDLTWLNALSLMNGWLDRLKLSDDGINEANEKFKVQASGMMKRYYGELVLSLSQNWNVYPFWFDWRKDLNLAADTLNVQVSAWFGETQPFHIIAHSMGGLVARTFTKRYRARWDAAWDKKAGGRLIMLGTPNYGSFSIPQMVVGLDGIVRKLAAVYPLHNRRQVLDILNSFVGPYQMLPSPVIKPELERLYISNAYGKVSVPQSRLDNARVHQHFLTDEIDERRMIYVAGYGQPTFSNINNWGKLEDINSYDITLDGDGYVPHSLGLLKRDGKSVLPTYFIRENHGNLSSNKAILSALDELLETGVTPILKSEVPASRGLTGDDAVVEMKRQVEKDWKTEEKQIKIAVGRLSGSSHNQGALSPISSDERKIEEVIARGLLGEQDERLEAVDIAAADISGVIEQAKIKIGLAWGSIERAHERKDIAGVNRVPIDAIAVGHYINVQPQAAELALDRSISLALLGRDSDDGESAINKADLILTQYTERGTIHGRLGQPFFMIDPRPEKNRRKKSAERVIAIAGMGEPGVFGSPELTVLARELCWSLGRMKKQHLATVLIGAGIGNIPLRDVVSAWMDGIRRALSVSKFDEGRELLRVTFVERDPRKIREINGYLKQEKEIQEKQGFKVKYEEWSDQQLDKLKKLELNWDRREWERRRKLIDDEEGIAPTRVTLSLDTNRKTYRFGAISADASVLERQILIDPSLVMKANDELAGEGEPPMQLERGRFLEELLLPDELRRQLYTNAPLVMMLDSTTARIHWEMVAQPDPGGSRISKPSARADYSGFEFANNFLGTTRGVTRQLRATFALPPEPPPTARRNLRVLVVAGPAEDYHLEGAQEEGVEVADLFESYNLVYGDRQMNNRVEVRRMFGPVEARRTNVLRELMSRPYDVLHFVGHCVYQWDGDPDASGWIFHNNPRELLYADELNRIDRIPKFVFSNACESGITPDRSGERTAALAPSFAEAFFARGVSNFVCAAWPVEDLAAREFALKLYGGLLGIEITKDNRYVAAEAKPMHLAMRDARLMIASTDNGVSAWGAYQHYGNPDLRLFQLPRMNEIQQKPVRRVAAKRKTSAVKKKRATKMKKR